MLPNSVHIYFALLFLQIALFFISVSYCKNFAYFKMYDVENIDGETPVLEFNQSEPHLSSDFQRIMSNTHQICTNGIWRLFPGSMYSLTGSTSAAASYPHGHGFGSSSAYETCTVLAQWEALLLAKMGSLRRVGPLNLDEVALFTYTGPYYSGTESVIDGSNMEDRNLRGYMDSYVITGPRNQHPDNASAFIPAFQFFQRERYAGEQTCLVMRNDQHGNHIPRKGAASTSSIYEEMVVNTEDSLLFGSVKLISYYEYFHSANYANCSSKTIFVPDEQDTEVHGTPYGYGGKHGSYEPATYGRSYHSPSDYPSYEPSYQPPYYQPSYQPAYIPPAYEPAYNPPSYDPSSYYPPAAYYPPSYTPSYQPSYTSDGHSDTPSYAPRA